jgi:transcriptional regulator with XRE-family HTH domain
MVSRGRAFHEWLRAQLAFRRMSASELARLSGVSATTISALVRGERMPSLGTATKLARGLREIRDFEPDNEPDNPERWITVQNPTARVEYALRADSTLAEPQVRQAMQFYLALRMQRINEGHGPPACPATPPPPPWEGYNLLPPDVAASFRAELSARARRRLIVAYGPERYVAAVGEVINVDVDGAGRPRRLWRALRPWDAPLVMVEVTNATPEADGSHSRHWLRVPPEMTTAKAAVAWTFELNPDRYTELVET